MIPQSFDIKIYHNRPPEVASESKDGGDGKMDAKFDPGRRELLFPVPEAKCPLRKGEWIVIEQKDAAEDGRFHCRVIETCCFPTVKLSALVNVAKLKSDMSTKAADLAPSGLANTSTGWLAASVESHNVVFDTLDDGSKRGVIVNLLDCLPSVIEMRNYLLSQRSPDLSKWVDRLSPPALAILRWVIASNRACIMQVYDMDPLTGRPVPKEDRVHGMKEWMQFRFAMGAPDKEKRFVKSVRETAARLNLSQHHTLFAWHGSRIENWHSIIREGLHFKDTINGRAYGDGIYHSLDFSTSIGYSTYRSGLSGHPSWPRSVLQIVNAMALNEIVNAPAEFRSQNPHLVVQHVDWVQTRYLFVKCSGEGVSDLDDTKPVHERSQERNMTPRNAQGNPLIIPAVSSATGKRRISSAKSPGLKKNSKKYKGDGLVDDPVVVDEDDVRYGDDGMSDTTDVDDIDIFFDESTTPPPPTPIMYVPSIAFDDIVLTLGSKHAAPQTDFVPGELDHDALPKLPMPEYANTTATKRLQADFKALLKVQESTPLHELGWYVDPSKFDCPYQWIVELHSFDTFEDQGEKLPIVNDMKEAGLKSIVLEMRFPGSYPMSPPFVRVIK